MFNQTLTTQRYAPAQVTQVNQIALPLQLVGSDGRPLFEFIEGAGGPVLRFLRPDGEPFLEMGAGCDGSSHVSIYRDEVTVAALASVDDGGSVFVRGGDIDGAFVDLAAHNGQAKINVGPDDRHFRDLAA